IWSPTSYGRRRCAAARRARGAGIFTSRARAKRANPATFWGRQYANALLGQRQCHTQNLAPWRLGVRYVDGIAPSPRLLTILHIAGPPFPFGDALWTPWTGFSKRPCAAGAPRQVSCPRRGASAGGTRTLSAPERPSNCVDVQSIICGR